MFRLSAFVGLAIAGLAFLVGTGASQDAKKADTPPAKTKAYLPPGWKDLGLTKEQTAKISDIHGNFKGKIKALEDQIKETKTQEKQEMVKLLTAEQKEKLLKLVLPDEPAPKAEAVKDAPKK